MDKLKLFIFSNPIIQNETNGDKEDGINNIYLNNP